MLRTIENRTLHVSRKLQIQDSNSGDGCEIRTRDEDLIERNGCTAVQDLTQNVGLLALKTRKFTPAGLVGAVATGAAIELTEEA